MLSEEEVLKKKEIERVAKALVTKEAAAEKRAQVTIKQQQAIRTSTAPSPCILACPACKHHTDAVAPLLLMRR